ncbi:MAG TPA: hypothetical protein VGM90_14370 [Kofleriaceae bacterium]|jgi:outer membrane protein assembly factor BamB
MRHVLALCLALTAACGKKSDSSSPTGSGSGGKTAGSGDVTAPPKAPAAMPPGLGGKVELPAATTGSRTIKPQKFRHSSVRGDFRIYHTAAGIVVSWRTMLSARSVDGKPMWKKENQGRAVAISADGSKLVTNNNDGELLILDAKTGEPIGAAAHLGGPSDDKHPDVWISAFAWLPDGKHILALDSKHAYLLGGDGVLQRELPIKCKEDCFFTSAAALSNDEVIIANGAGTSGGQVMRVKVADGSVVVAVDTDGHDVDVSADHTQVVVDADGEVLSLDPASLTPRWTVSIPGFRGVALEGAADGSSFEWKPVPKLSPDGKHVVVNDIAGRLWILDAATGAPQLAYPNELVDFVEDAIWLDGATLIAIDNPGHVMKIAGTPAKAVWSEMDGPTDGEWDGPN